MRARVVSAGLMLLLISGTVSTPSASALLPAVSCSTFAARRDVLFIENVGQFDEEARFQVYGGDRQIWLTEEAIWVTILEPSGVNLRLSFVGANPQPHLRPFDRLETSISYFIGSDPALWHSQVPVWGGVRYAELYPGIDLEVLGDGGHVTWRMVARPGADLSTVRLRVEGAEEMTLDGDALRLRTAAGDYSLPLFQVSGAGYGNLSRLLVLGDQALSPFVQGTVACLGSTSSSTSTLLYSTFLGSEATDMGRGIAVDASGAAYIIGDSNSADFPTTPGAFDRSQVFLPLVAR